MFIGCESESSSVHSYSEDDQRHAVDAARKHNVKTLHQPYHEGDLETKRKMRAAEIVAAVSNDPTKVDPWGATMFACMMVASRALRRSPDRTKKLFESVRLVEKSDVKGIQGTVHTLHVILDLLQLDLKCINGAWIIIDEHGARVDFLQANNHFFKSMLTMWIRKAIVQQLHDRAKLGL